MFQLPHSHEDLRQLRYHLDLLKERENSSRTQEITTSPIFTAQVLKHTRKLNDTTSGSFTQYGLIGGVGKMLEEETSISDPDTILDPRLFFNVAAPSSTFICGSQGSGKSHTLSCLLENCLIPSDAGSLPKPLTGLVFHYDAFISDDGGSPCEAAFLSSDKQIKVRVICSPTNIRTIQRTYQALNVEVEPLQIDQADLNTKRMLDLMAVNQDDGPVPLYLHTVYRILRNMRIMQQETGGLFDYDEFKRQVMDAGLSPAQLSPLSQRLDTLESFMSASHQAKNKKKATRRRGTDWTSKSGYLTILDLSCPCVTPESACSLFNVSLSIFLEQDTRIGRVVALDEAHKFMNTSAEAMTFTNTLLATIRLQRHLGVRIIISTQEPTVSSELLDLSSVTIVHRFTSPVWLRRLRAHLAAAATDLVPQKANDSEDKDDITPDNYSSAGKILDKIVGLRVGEALLFAPTTAVRLEIRDDQTLALTRLGATYLKIKVRSRLTTDGGLSVLADGNS